MRKKILNFADYINEQESRDLTELLIGRKEDVERKISEYGAEQFVADYNTLPQNIRVSIFQKIRKELNIKSDFYGVANNPKLQTILNQPAPFSGLINKAKQIKSKVRGAIERKLDT